jgi:hypothetical protein
VTDAGVHTICGSIKGDFNIITHTHTHVSYYTSIVDSGSQKGHLELLLDAYIRLQLYQQAPHRVVVPGALFESQSLAHVYA